MRVKTDDYEGPSRRMNFDGRVVWGWVSSLVAAPALTVIIVWIFGAGELKAQVASNSKAIESSSDAISRIDVLGTEIQHVRETQREIKSDIEDIEDRQQQILDAVLDIKRR